MIRKYKLSAAILASIICLTGCSTSNTETVPDTPIVLEHTQPKQEPIPVKNISIKEYADNLVAQVVNSITVEKGGKVAIATPVDVKSLESTDWLGRELAEAFVGSLHNKGFQVLEYKLKGWLEITQDGDYIYSRNWQKLATSAKVTRILSGTMSRNEQGVMVYARLVNLKNLMVEGTGEIFIPYSDLPSFYKTSPMVPVVQENSPKENHTPANSRKPSGEKPHTSSPKDEKSDARTKNNQKPQASNKQDTKKRDDKKTDAKNSGKGSVASTPKPQSLNKNDGKDYALNQNTNPDPVVYASTGAVNSGNQACATCGSATNSKAKKYCHDKCQDPINYPATTYQQGGKLVRDAGFQSQYDRN